MSRTVFYVQYTNPAFYPPLEHSSRILAHDGWRVRFLGTRVSPGDRVEFPAHPNIGMERMAFCAAGWRQKLHYLRFCGWVFASVMEDRPPWIYASDTLSCPLALALSWLPGVRVIYHEHDSPAPAGGQSGWFQRLTLRARSALAARAEFCILPNRQRADRFAAAHPGAPSVLCIWNCPSRDEVAQPRRRSHEQDFWILYQGSLVPARLPKAILTAMSELPAQVKLRLVGYETGGFPNFVKDYLAAAEKLGLHGRIEVAGVLPLRSQMLESSYGCHVGLSLMPMSSEDQNEQSMTGASNKPFDYLACGLAVLVSALADWKAMFVDPGFGLSCAPDDADSITRALRWFYEHPEETRCMGEKGRLRIASEWNYETQFAPVMDRLGG